jgi:SpoVK/Ycf46/Vps4 family AAA+-type ATPase
MRLEGSFDLEALARRTAGFVGADLASLCKEAAVLAVKRAFTGKTIYLFTYFFILFRIGFGIG